MNSGDDSIIKNSVEDTAASTYNFKQPSPAAGIQAENDFIRQYLYGECYVKRNSDEAVIYELTGLPDLPDAVVCDRETGLIKQKIWADEAGNMHRDDGYPAVEIYDNREHLSELQWWQNGKHLQTLVCDQFASTPDPTNANEQAGSPADSSKIARFSSKRVGDVVGRQVHFTEIGLKYDSQSRVPEFGLLHR